MLLWSSSTSAASAPGNGRASCDEEDPKVSEAASVRLAAAGASVASVAGGEAWITVAVRLLPPKIADKNAPISPLRSAVERGLQAAPPFTALPRRRPTTGEKMLLADGSAYDKLEGPPASASEAAPLASPVTRFRRRRLVACVCAVPILLFLVIVPLYVWVSQIPGRLPAESSGSFDTTGDELFVLTVADWGGVPFYPYVTPAQLGVRDQMSKAVNASSAARKLILALGCVRVRVPPVLCSPTLPSDFSSLSLPHAFLQR